MPPRRGIVTSTIWVKGRERGSPPLQPTGVDCLEIGSLRNAGVPQLLESGVLQLVRQGSEHTLDPQESGPAVIQPDARSSTVRAKVRDSSGCSAPTPTT